MGLKDLVLILKHLPGQHSQQSHAGDREGSGGSYRDLNDPENAQEFMDDMSNWSDNLSGTQRTSISDYSLQIYARMNDQMRNFEGKNPVTAFENPEDRKRFLAMHNALAKASTPYPVTVYRGIDGSVFEGLKAGDTYTEKAFTSTSMSKKEAKTHVEKSGKGGVMVEIRLPEGTNAAPLGNISSFTTADEGDEKEVLIQWGMNYNVVSKSKSNVVLEATSPFWKR